MQDWLEKIEDTETFSELITETFDVAYFKRKEINLFKIPINYITWEQDATTQKFSAIYRFIKKYYDSEIVRTKSKGISIIKQNISKNRYIVIQSTTQVEFIISLYSFDLIAKAYKENKGPYIYARFIISNGKRQQKSGMNGRTAFSILKDELNKDGILLSDYAIDNGKQIKEEIKKPMITETLFAKLDKEYNNVHHIDLNSAYSSAIIKEHPELSTTYQRLYQNRHKDNDTFKDVLNMSIGFMQSQYCIVNGHGYSLANLSKTAVNGCYDAINEIYWKLIDAGRKPLLFNTDGLWYQGDIYHDENEGTELGQWKNDHVNCKFRIRSKGAYEFIENGKYKPVFRGESTYERIKSRDEWEWGDIYRGSLIEYYWNEELGTVRCING